MADAGTKLTPAQKIEKARRAYEEINRGEYQAGDYAPDAVWHSYLWGEVRGPEAVRATLARAAEAFDEMSLEPHAILADDEHVVALLNLKIRAKGQTVEQQVVQVAHVNDAGQVTEMWTTGGDPTPVKKLLGR
jgi:ketosteroid isomerase-like protein